MSIYKQIKAYDDTFFNKNVTLNEIGGETKIEGDLTSKKNVYFGESSSNNFFSLDDSGAISVSGSTKTLFNDSEVRLMGGLNVNSGTSVFNTNTEFNNDISYNNGSNKFTITDGGGVETDLLTNIENKLEVKSETQVKGDLNLIKNLNVAQETVLTDDVVFKNNLYVNGTTVTKHEEKFFVGDNHITLNDGMTTTGTEHAGIVTVYDVKLTGIEGSGGITFNGAGDDMGIITGLTESAVTTIMSEYTNCIIKITGAGEFDGFYLIAGNSYNTDAIRLYSNKNNDSPEWHKERMPFLKEVSWGAGTANTSNVTKSDAKASVVAVNHLLVHGNSDHEGDHVGEDVSHGDGKLYVCNGLHRSDFYDDILGIWRYQEIGGSTILSWEEVSTDHTLRKQVTSVKSTTSTDITVTLSKNDLNGTRYKIVNHGDSLSSVVVKTEGEGGLIDGYTDDFTLLPGQHITVVKYEDGDQNVTVDKWAIM